MPETNPLLDELDARGLLHDSTDRAALVALLNTERVTLYSGYDPTADSLHVGHLQGLVTLRRFLDAGHRLLVLVGGATGMIGDPSGRSDERNLLDDETVAGNARAIAAQVERVLGGVEGWELVDNATWTAGIGLVDFLRDVGKHITVNQMVARESVQSRIQGEAGISFTEFAYQLLQAHDFWWLYTNRGCRLQVGGSDQWGNIVAGIDLIRRKGGGSAYGMTWPLLVRSDGSKFGKSASGESVWLDPSRTSPYRFFQFFMNADDADVERLLLRFTLVPLDDVASTIADHVEAPGRRGAQALLADEVTTMVHGAAACATARAASRLLFGGSARDADAEVLASLVDEIPTARVTPAEVDAGIAMLDAFVATGLSTSKGEARRALTQGGGYCNDERIADDATLSSDLLLHGRFALLRRGRRAYALVVVGDT